MIAWRDELLRRFPALAHLPPRCYVVGGAIRDLLLGRDPADADVACDDPLAAAKMVSNRVIRLGADEHLRAYRVVLPEHVYDFAELLEHDIGPDLARRDFTVNAMAVDLQSGELLDPHGGQRDIEQRLVRMVDASNFDDDPLRMLKAVRMAVRYDFELDPATLEAIRARAPRINESARERITYELSVIFTANRFRRAVELLRATGLDVPLHLRTREFHADDVSLAGAYALLTDEASPLQKLIDEHDRIALYDAGEDVARQLPAVLRALGRNDALDWPDFSTRALLSGEDIARLTGVPPGKQLGAIKRALLEAQLRGEIESVDDAERFVRNVTASA
jgi:Poly A polymerase head domain/Probable RNA and SrmB- binding site of polymerase A